MGSSTLLMTQTHKTHFAHRGLYFCVSGLIKYLDNASSLAGVIGHEMGHADHRHSTTQMTKQYGIQTLLDVVLGNNQNQLTQIASSLVNLAFSRR
jgi:predicted Zn-dependent protease